MDTEPTTKRTPPYMSFETFKNFVSRLSYEDLPPRIDRSMMVGMAGGVQTTTISTMREFGLIEGENNAKTPKLDEFAKATEHELPELFEALVREYYSAELALSQQKGTAAQLDELFADRYGVTGSTRRKAVTFFLHVAKYAKVPLSPHFKAPRSVPSGKRPSSSRGSTSTDGAGGLNVDPPPPPAPGASAHSKTINLPGATITLSYTADLFELSTDDRDFILKMVDNLKTYEADQSALAPLDLDHQGEDISP